MKKQYHILNGDALKKQFPKTLEGEVIVTRECLVDGNVEGETLDDLFKTRAHFISQNYAGYNETDYFEKTIPEFYKITDIQDNTEINLWFEDDLFCQVNFWFVCSLLNNYQKNNSIHLIRPKKHSQYGFGGLNTAELIEIYKKRTQITKLDEIANLWTCYQKEDLNNILKIAVQLQDRYPFILRAVKAHIDRIPANGNPGRPTIALLEIMKDLKTREFVIVFKEFCKRESIYGFGDLQVKRLFDQIIG